VPVERQVHELPAGYHIAHRIGGFDQRRLGDHFDRIVFLRDLQLRVEPDALAYVDSDTVNPVWRESRCGNRDLVDAGGEDQPISSIGGDGLLPELSVSRVHSLDHGSIEYAARGIGYLSFQNGCCVLCECHDAERSRSNDPRQHYRVTNPFVASLAEHGNSRQYAKNTI